MRMANFGNTARMATVFAVLALFTMVSTAGAVGLRVPQIPIFGSSLQSYLNAVDGGFNVNNSQVDAQNFAANISGNTDFTLMIELSGSANVNTIGVYNAGDAVPALNQLFPGAATAGWSVFCTFKSTGELIVNLFDNTSTLVGTTHYFGVTRTAFAFYLQNNNGTFYSQDYRNLGGHAQVLTFAGTNYAYFNQGDWWECFEDAPFGATSDFDDAVLLLQSIAPTPVPTSGTTWGALKATYR
jgi:hypothetical protein